MTGMCVERPVKLKVDGKLSEATAFTTAPSRAMTDGPVSQRFVEALVRGAQSSGLPAEYVKRLQTSAR